TSSSTTASTNRRAAPRQRRRRAWISSPSPEGSASRTPSAPTPSRNSKSFSPMRSRGASTPSSARASSRAAAKCRRGRGPTSRTSIASRATSSRPRASRFYKRAFPAAGRKADAKIFCRSGARADLLLRLRRRAGKEDGAAHRQLSFDQRRAGRAVDREGDGDLPEKRPRGRSRLYYGRTPLDGGPFVGPAPGDRHRRQRARRGEFKWREGRGSDRHDL